MKEGLTIEIEIKYHNLKYVLRYFRNHLYTMILLGLHTPNQNVKGLKCHTV